MIHTRTRNSVTASVVGCVLFCFSAGSAIGQQQETAEQFVERVKKAIQNDEWGRARSGIKHALDLKPNSPEANFIAAQVYQHGGARSLAIEALEKAIENQPEYPAAHLLLARCLADDYKFDKAREEANISMAQGASPFSAYRLLAEVDLAKEDYESAVVSLETALHFSTGSDDPDAAIVRQQISALGNIISKVKTFADVEGRQKQLDIVGPVLLNNPSPRYTEEARALKIQGPILLIAVINEKGDVEYVTIIRGLPGGLDEQAIALAKELKFSPATQGGKPIHYVKRIKIEFNLR